MIARFWAWLDERPRRWLFLVPLLIAAILVYMGIDPADRYDGSRSSFFQSAAFVAALSPLWLFLTSKATPPSQD